MINHKSQWLPVGIGAVVGVILAAGSGCGSEAEPVAARVAPPPAAPPPPSAPTVTPVEQLIADLRIDERVDLPEDRAPGSDPDRKAVLEFFDAFARGDAEAVGSMVPRTDRGELDELVSSGVWGQTVGDISRIEVQTGKSPYDQKCALAIFHVAGDFQPQLWYYSSDDEGFMFQAAATPPDIMEKLSGEDWIAAWHDILADELARADDPDEEFEVPQRNYEDDGGGGGSKTRRGGGTPGRTPQLPPGGPRRRQPKSPRKPPGF